MTDYDPLRLAGEQFDARPRMTEAERLAAVAYDTAHLAAVRARAAELLGDGPAASIFARCLITSWAAAKTTSP